MTGYHAAMGGKVVIAVSDLLFQTRIEAALRAAGSGTIVADTPAALDDALDSGPSVVVIDVHETAFSATDAIARATAANARVLAFGRHTAPVELRAARDAGAEMVVPRSDLAERLPELLDRLLAVPRANPP
jgi:DNA-binding NarL/FixJ family response regulator